MVTEENHAQSDTTVPDAAQVALNEAVPGAMTQCLLTRIQCCACRRCIKWLDVNSLHVRLGVV